MKWRTESDFPEKSGMYITELEIKEDGVTYNPVAYNFFDSILLKWPNPRTCSEDAKVTRWLDQSAPFKEGEEDAVEFAEWIGDQLLEFERGKWSAPNLKGDIENGYTLHYEGHTTTEQLYKIFKQSKGTG